MGKGKGKPKPVKPQTGVSANSAITTTTTARSTSAVAVPSSNLGTLHWEENGEEEGETPQWGIGQYLAAGYAGAQCGLIFAGMVHGLVRIFSPDWWVLSAVSDGRRYITALVRDPLQNEGEDDDTSLSTSNLSTSANVGDGCYGCCVLFFMIIGFLLEVMMQGTPYGSVLFSLSEKGMVRIGKAVKRRVQQIKRQESRKKKAHTTTPQVNVVIHTPSKTK